MTTSVAELQWFIDMLKREENETELGNLGGVWIPHESPEGGEDTIGYGHKLVRGRDENVTILGREFNLFTDHIPQKYIEALLIQDIIKKEKLSAKQFEKHKPMGKGVKWLDINPVYRAMLTEINFNAGLIKSGKWAWPKLAKAMKAESDEVFNQLGRTYDDPKKGKTSLDKRVNGMVVDYKKALKEDPPPEGVKGVADKLSKDFPWFDKMNNRGKVRAIKKFMDETKLQEVASIEARQEFEMIQEEADIQDREAWEALQEQLEKEAQATPTEGENSPQEAPQAVDEGYIEQEKLSQVEYFQREDGVIIKMVNGEATEL